MTTRILAETFVRVVLLFFVARAFRVWGLARLELEDLLLAISLRQAGGDRVLDGYCPAKRARHY